MSVFEEASRCILSVSMLLRREAKTNIIGNMGVNFVC